VDANANSIHTRPLAEGDVETLANAFNEIGWSKPAALFLGYLDEQEKGVRWVRVAEWKGQVAGYVTVLWTSADGAFRENGIPEIADLNVLPGLRNLGIGSTLLAEAEEEVSNLGNTVGIRVGLHSGYGAAQRIYIGRGYVPDGAGVVVDGRPVAEGAVIRLDDDATLRMTKKL
jgi:GNAT superfamily N-acetyltransferase